MMRVPFETAAAAALLCCMGAQAPSGLQYRSGHRTNAHPPALSKPFRPRHERRPQHGTSSGTAASGCGCSRPVAARPFSGCCSAMATPTGPTAEHHMFSQSHNQQELYCSYSRSHIPNQRHCFTIQSDTSSSSSSSSSTWQQHLRGHVVHLAVAGHARGAGQDAVQADPGLGGQRREGQR